MAQHAQNRRGILAMLAAMACFSVSDTLIKLAAASMGTGQIMVVRGLFATLLAAGLVAATSDLRLLRLTLGRKVLLRSLAEAAIAFTFVTAIARLPLAIITAIYQATPIILTVLTVLMRIETVGWRRWVAILVGFAGVLLIVRPSPEGVDAAILIALASATIVAVRDLITRRITAAVPTVVITFATTATVTAAGGLLILVDKSQAWLPLSARDYGLLAAAAAIVTAGNLAMVAAFRGTEMSVVSPFRYSVLVWAIGFGYVVFGEWPDLVACLGIALIVAAGIYTVHRERIRARQAVLEAGDPPG